jgi:MafB19-like deaminase
LFGQRRGTVTVTTINGKYVFGSNSNSPTYTRSDQALAEGVRQALIQKYPAVMKSDNIGQKPNDALFHAEATVLLRAARENGGTLAGQTLEVFADRPMCDSCLTVLPKLGFELGNPTVTFVDNAGKRLLMRDGDWHK